MNNNERLRELYLRFLDNDLSQDELGKFLEMVDQSSADTAMNELMDATWKEMNERGKQPMTPVVPMVKKGRMYRFVAAAAIIILFAGSAYFIFFNKIKQPILANVHKTSLQLKNDAAPGKNTALLILDDGTQILLDSTAVGILAKQGNAKIQKLTNGRLAYTALNEKSNPILYNTVSTPRGGQYEVELPDGSKVWLNAASSLRFPTTFKGNERLVELTGEAYFEVMPMNSKGRSGKIPFRVIIASSPEKERGEVEVLGTHFNINAYAEEPLVKTTLLEGSVKMKKGNITRLLEPGQQAQLNQNGEIKLVKDADVEEAIAWKNGLFQFNKAGIETVMNQVARWYDIETIYEGDKPSGHFRGKISKYIYLSEMLKVIEASGVHFKIEGKKIIVKP